MHKCASQGVLFQILIFVIIRDIKDATRVFGMPFSLADAGYHNLAAQNDLPKTDDWNTQYDKFCSLFAVWLKMRFLEYIGVGSNRAAKEKSY